ncbi:intercellular adhesion molecule 1-like isoform X2 [Myripristis murdjan]|uniref:intercellular adhesion molecule 1-like isoform X2 n=1 Tax=Myripristis murdjan TaxID=586833 RepID=UPI001175E1A7|nr:intercellular adhesion molecule 1-like isoform X2 [Myripristis murdjan]
MAGHSSPLPPPWVSPLSLTPPFIDSPTGSSKQERCPLIITPSTLVVRFGDPATANCSGPQMTHSGLGWEVQQGAPDLTGGEFLVWRVDNLTVWSLKPMCYALVERGDCVTGLNLTVYKPPDLVSISYLNHTGPLIEGHVYTLQCTVENVAPVGSLSVTFYRGQEALGPPQSRNNSEKKPVTEIFTLNIKPTGEDQEGHYWCEAKLELGPEGPQPPPVVKSQNLTATVYFGPQFLCPTNLKVEEGEKLTCEVKGNPLPLVTWLRDGMKVAPPLHSNRKHSGKYTVQAEGALGQKNLTLEVEIIISSGTSNTGGRNFLLAVLLLKLISWL